MKWWVFAFSLDAEHCIQCAAQFNSVQLLSRVWLFVTPWIAARQATLSITNSRSSSKPRSIESVMPSSHLILCRPLLSCPQSLPASESFPMNQLFAWGGQSIGVSALASVLPMNTHWCSLEHLISFRMDWLDLLEVQWSLRSLLQHHNSKASILQCSDFFMVQLSHSYHDYWKNHSFDHTEFCWQNDTFTL